MTENRRAGIVVAGIGNRLGRDDGAGPAVCDALRGLLAAEIAAGRVEVCEEWGEGARLITLMEGRETVIFIDAASSGAEPGHVQVFDAGQQEIPAGLLCYSTHRFGVAEAVEVARNLGMMPERVVLYAIEGADFGTGEGLSAPVAQAVAKLCGQISAGFVTESRD